MPHLVTPILEVLDVADVLKQVEQAHRFLVEAAKETIAQLQAVGEEEWGETVKRRYVVLTGKPRPYLVPETVGRHSFAEVVNQCATIERLLDALRWSQDALPGYKVEVCNPTTSSQKTEQGRDNDLILIGPSGEVCCFEVSDVAASKDGNKKEIKDLVSLGVLHSTDGELTSSKTWPEGRLFLVVSKEFAEYLMRTTRLILKQGWFHYQDISGQGTSTRIIEVMEGPGETVT